MVTKVTQCNLKTGGSFIGILRLTMKGSGRIASPPYDMRRPAMHKDLNNACEICVSGYHRCETLLRWVRSWALVIERIRALLYADYYNKRWMHHMSFVLDRKRNVSGLGGWIATRVVTVVAARPQWRNVENTCLVVLHLRTIHGCPFGWWWLWCNGYYSIGLCWFIYVLVTSYPFCFGCGTILSCLSSSG